MYMQPAGYHYSRLHTTPSQHCSWYHLELIRRYPCPPAHHLQVTSESVRCNALIFPFSVLESTTVNGARRKKNSDRIYAKLRRASATAPLHTGAEKRKIGACAGKDCALLLVRPAWTVNSQLSRTVGCCTCNVVNAVILLEYRAYQTLAASDSFLYTVAFSLSLFCNSVTTGAQVFTLYTAAMSMAAVIAHTFAQNSMRIMPRSSDGL